MKPVRLTSFLLALTIAAGCASTEVTDRDSQMGDESIARPETIYVYPFAATRAEIPRWSAAATRYPEPAEPQTAEEIAAGRELGALVAEELAADIRDMGLAAVRASRATTPMSNDLMITGYFEAIEAGSAGRRVLLGFGSGSAELRTVVEGYQMTSLGPRLLGSGTVESSGNKTPGAVAPLAVLAATGNPVGLIVMGTGKLVGEASGRSKIEGAAKRTADRIASELRVRFRELGWIE